MKTDWVDQQNEVVLDEPELRSRELPIEDQTTRECSKKVSLCQAAVVHTFDFSTRDAEAGGSL